jgi:hypothetical protein
MTIAAPYPLTKTVKRILDLLRVLAFVGLILWPLFVLFTAIGQNSHPDTWGVDIDVFSQFNIDLTAFTQDVSSSPGVRDPSISGKALLKIDTSSLHALYLFTVLLEISGAVGLYVVIQLRALFGSLANGLSFTPENSGRIRKIGTVVILWAFINPLLQYFGGQAILIEYALNVPGLQLSPAFEVNGMAIFIGLAMIVLSGVLNEAAHMHDVQKLTI